MDGVSPNDQGKKSTLEDLSKDELVKRCERLLLLAQKAKQAKDLLQNENDELKRQNNGVSSEIIENLTQQKLDYVTTIESLKNQNVQLTSELQKCTIKLSECEEKNSSLDNENVSYTRQIQRLTDENEHLIGELESLEKQMEECKKLGLQQQNQLLALEQFKKELEDRNKELQNNSNSTEMQKMLTISLDEVKKLQNENSELRNISDALKTQLCNKDESILNLKDELEVKAKEISELLKLTDNNETKLLKSEIEELNQHSVKVKNQLELSEETVIKLKERLKFYHGKLVKFAGNVKIIKEDKNEILAMFKKYIAQVEIWKVELNTTSQKLFLEFNTITNQNLEYLNEIEILKENNAKFIQAHKTDDEKSKELCQIESMNNENERLNKEVAALLETNQQCNNKIELLQSENEDLNGKLDEIANKYDELKLSNNKSKQNSEEIQTRIEENEKICIEYRKIISKLEKEKETTVRDMDELKQKNHILEKSIQNAQEMEREFIEKTSKEILKLAQENANLLEEKQKLSEKQLHEKHSQTDEDVNDLETTTESLKRENLELLKEMNQMNQALKERGETISKLQAHCEEVMKKLQISESQANKNVDSIWQKEEIIKHLEEEIVNFKNHQCTNGTDLILKKDLEISELRNEIDRLNSNLDNSYTDNENMSTSTISRTEEANRMKDLEGSWEERYGKLRALAVKLKGKVRDLSSDLVKEQNEKNDIQQKIVSNTKIISTLQSQNDHLQDDLEVARMQLKEYSEKLETVSSEESKEKQKLNENENLIVKLKTKIEELNQEKANTDSWKQQISAKVQTFRKELEANKILKKEYEAKILKLTSDLDAKEQALKAESDGHQQTKHSLEHSNSERMKNSVLNLEMQDYERSVKELSQKLEKKQEEINKLNNQLESQKLASSAIKEQNKILEERSQELKNEYDVASLEISNYKKQFVDMEEILLRKENQIQSLTQLLEATKLEKEELSTELSQVITEHQKRNNNLKAEREQLRTQVFGLQQTSRDIQDALKLKEDELKIIQSDYDNYKVRAQSVLRQNHNRDVGLEEKMSEELSTIKEQCERLTSELNEYKNMLENVNKNNLNLVQEKEEIACKYEEISSEVEDLKLLYEQLTNKHQQTIIEHSETVRSLKINAETLSQCYRQQLSEQEVRHNREIIELQSKIEKAPSPIESSFRPIAGMHREEGEGSESTETSSKNIPPVSLERLLSSDSEQEVASIKKQLSEEELKVIHLTALLADTEQDLAKHVQMTKVLKEEIRRQQRSVEREEHAKNLEYLKNVVFKFLTLHNGDERSRLVPVLNTILKFSPEETQKLNLVARGDPGIRGWTNYLPLWSSPSKP